MSVRFKISEKLYSTVIFEIEGKEQDEVDEVLDEIGDTMSADDLYTRLTDIFGDDNVKAEGLNSSDSIYPADEYEFINWEEN